MHLKSEMALTEGPGLADSEESRSAVDVRCFPSEDADFADAVLAVVAEMLGASDDGDELLDRGDHSDGLRQSVESRVREAYPRATIRRRDMLAEFGLTTRELWYAFRDGSVSLAD